MKTMRIGASFIAAFCLLGGGAFSALTFQSQPDAPSFTKLGGKQQPSAPRNLARNFSWTSDSPPPVRLVQYPPTASSPGFKPPGFIMQLTAYPKPSRNVVAQVILAGGANLPTSKAYISLQINGTFDKDEYRILFQAQHADGTPAGQINGPEKEDDLVYWDDHKSPYIPFRSDSKTGKIEIWAEAIDANGNIVSTSNRHTIQSILPDLRVTYGEWKSSSKAGTWERRVYVAATTKALGTIDLTGTPVKLTVAPVTSVGALPKASYLSKTNGATVNEWVNRGERMTDDLPFTATQYWLDTPDGTRQLNAYRVQVVVDENQLVEQAPHPSAGVKENTPQKKAHS